MKDKKNVSFLLWIKRLFIYLAGLYCMAIGVVLSATSSLGVSPVGSPANVLSLIASDLGWPSFFSLGNCTILIYCVYILIEIVILRKDFRPVMLLQLLASLLFGRLIVIATAMLSFLPAPEAYPVKMLYLLLSIPAVAIGVMLYLSPDILPTPGEGMSLAISKKTGITVGTGKLIFDCSVVVVSVAGSLIYFHSLQGIREGTIICALCVGPLMKQFQKLFQEPVLRFVERQSKLERAIAAAGGYTMDINGNPKVIITIGREFGSAGFEIGQKLAEKLNIPCYYTQIDKRASEISGMPIEKVEELEHHMERELVFDLKYAAYNMTNQELSPAEQLFVAQTQAIKEIQAKNESCVIIGRCADYTLYNDPNCFRVFVHALPRARIDRTMKKYNLNEEEARKYMENTDAARARHYKYFTNREYGKQVYYHLSFDSSTLGVDSGADLIMDAVKKWCDVRGTKPLCLM